MGGRAACYPHEYQRNGTAKLLTLFHPASGQLRVQGVRQSTNAILHPWLYRELGAVLETAPPLGQESGSSARRQQWQQWQQGLTVRITLPQRLPRLRMLLVLDNLTGHKTPAFVRWLFSQGVMPLYTPLGGSWLNMAESAQRIIRQRALAGQHPQTADDIITLLETTAAGWNREPTPFEWGGKRQARRPQVPQYKL